MIFRRQKIYIGKPYEKVQWCCIRHIENKSQCSLKAIREDVIQQAFIVMWNKLISNAAEILSPLLESLRRLRTDEHQEQQIWEHNNKIMELSKQSHILSRAVSKGYLDSAVFIERNNLLTLELEAVKKKRNQLLDSSGFEREITQTEALLELIRSHPEIQEEYNEELFLQTVDQIIVNKNHVITFRLKNGLELMESCRKEVREA